VGFHWKKRVPWALNWNTGLTYS